MTDQESLGHKLKNNFVSRKLEIKGGGELAPHPGEMAPSFTMGIEELTPSPSLRWAVPAVQTDHIEYHPDPGL